jgi:hypothetical protein
VRFAVERRHEPGTIRHYVVDVGGSFDYAEGLPDATTWPTAEEAIEAVRRRNANHSTSTFVPQFSLVPVEVPEPAIRRMI